MLIFTQVLFVLVENASRMRISCKGKAYTTKSVLKCEFHQLAYQTECELRANDAESVIHP